MEKENLKEIKKRLEKEKSSLEKELSNFAEKDKNLKGDWDTKLPDIGYESTDDTYEDAAKQREEYERLLPVEFAMETKLKNISLALHKIEKGKYGLCEKCGKDISAERLKVVPEARFCAKCQE